jgi:hypothetical protein
MQRVEKVTIDRLRAALRRPGVIASGMIAFPLQNFVGATLCDFGLRC